MNFLRHTIKCAAGLLAVGIAIIACNKPDEITVPFEGTIYMPQAFAEKSAITLILADSAEKIAFGGAYAGLGFPNSDIPLNFELKPSLVSTYNASNGTSYRLLPDSAYTIQGLSSVIPSGKTTSNPLTLSVASKKLSRDFQYILPIELMSAGGSKIDSARKIAYIRIENIIRKETDITQLAKLSVSQEHRDGPGAGEASSKLVDGSVDTKFLLHSFPANFWAQLSFETAKVVGAYTMTSANDQESRDPKNWRFQGSNDGTNWIDLDVQTDILFTDYKQTKRFEFDNNTPYKHYRLRIEALRSNPIGGLFQLAEWRLITFK
ncbi:DUF1735 domain-containing protein [Niabella yanshanensis]|uniref:DUF1735 domain-containing protein n=1 Tax=Niabella yanshanensis TaxID=577386 RepID=A0ABZ0W6Q8_9BACT|nr:DUF1735 domain-containing protein [Niabella yanshanensis]WQD38172.1 DUF1735 domain-containing protein [Niabella yanshanensis]